MNKITTIGIALVLANLGLQPVNASLLGMPLNLKAATEPAGLDGFASSAIVLHPSCEFYTDDVFTGPLLVRSC